MPIVKPPISKCKKTTHDTGGPRDVENNNNDDFWGGFKSWLAFFILPVPLNLYLYFRICIFDVFHLYFVFGGVAGASSLMLAAPYSTPSSRQSWSGPRPSQTHIGWLLLLPQPFFSISTLFSLGVDPGWGRNDEAQDLARKDKEILWDCLQEAFWFQHFWTQFCANLLEDPGTCLRFWFWRRLPLRKTTVPSHQNILPVDKRSN